MAICENIVEVSKAYKLETKEAPDTTNAPIISRTRNQFNGMALRHYVNYKYTAIGSQTQMVYPYRSTRAKKAVGVA